MKKTAMIITLLVIIALIAAPLTACEGPQGEQGPPGPPGVVSALKTADEARPNEGSGVYDADLSLSLEAGKSYIIDGCIFFDTIPLDVGFYCNFLWLGDSGHTMDLGIIVTDTYHEVFLNIEYLTEGSTSAQLLSGSATSVDCVMYVNGSFTAPSDGTLGFYWGQIDSDPYATTVYGGSYMSAMEVN